MEERKKMIIQYKNVVYDTLNVSQNMVKAWVQQAYRSLVIHGMKKTVFSNYNLWEISVVEAVKRLKKNNKGLVKFKFHNQKKKLVVEIDDSIAEESLDKLIPRLVTFQEVKKSFNKRFGKIRNILKKRKKEKQTEELYKEGLDKAKEHINEYEKDNLRSRQFYWFFANNMIDVQMKEQIGENK